MQQREKNNKGFNILELLVVLAIVGVISAVAYPNFSSWNKEREVRQSVARISTLIKNILIQTERGTFAYVQVLFDNSDSSNLVVTSKGMTMQSLATKINDGDDVWNTDGSFQMFQLCLGRTGNHVGEFTYSITDFVVDFFSRDSQHAVQHAFTNAFGQAQNQRAGCLS